MASTIQFAVETPENRLTMTLEADFDAVYRPSIIASLFCEELLKLPLAGKRVLDIGAGSGVLSIAAALRGAQVTAADINPAAVETTLANAKRNNVAIEGVLSDGFSAVERADFDLVIANCPLAPTGLMTRAAAPVDDGEDGLRLFAHVAAEAATHVSPSGMLLTAGGSSAGLAKCENLLMRAWDFVERRRQAWLRLPRQAIADGVDIDAFAARYAEDDLRVVDGALRVISRLYLARGPR